MCWAGLACSASLLVSRKPLIYSGVFGRGLFQTMYEPPSSLTAVLPLSLTVALTALEFLVAFLQAYVFTILTCIYINDAIHPGH